MINFHTDPPLPGAEVFLDGVSVGFTGTDGSLTIAEVTAGSHTIEARKEGYAPDSATISVPETQSVTLTLTRIAKIRTEVRISSDKTTYTVGETAHITQGLYDEAGNIILGRTVDYTATRDGAWYAGWGQYSDDPSRGLLLNALGAYVITGNFLGDDTYEPSSKSVTITAITRIYTVVVTVMGSGPIGGASVYLDDTLVDLTDAAGKVTIPNVGAGPHTIRASKGGYYDATQTFSVPETLSITLALTPLPPELYTVTIEVRDPEMVPVEGVSVYLGNYPMKRTDASGGAVFLEVPGGLYSVVAEKELYERVSTRISVPDTTTLTVTIRILPREPTRDVDYHWDGLNWVCNYCAAASANEGAIIDHIKAKHPEELGLPPPPPPPEYRCGYCGAMFYTKAELDSHIATVHAIITIGVKVTEEDGRPIARAEVQVGGVGGVWNTGSDGIAWIPGYRKGTTGSIRVRVGA